MGLVGALLPPHRRRLKLPGQSFSGRQVALAALLLGLLLWLGLDAEWLFAALTRFWQAAFAGLGLGGWLGRLQHGTSPEVAKRSLPALVSYAALYLAASLLLLRVLLADAARWRLALRLYAAALLLVAALLLLGKLGGGVVLLYKAARRLIDFVVSPLPVLLLAVLLRSRLLWPPNQAP